MGWARPAWRHAASFIGLAAIGIAFAAHSSDSGYQQPSKLSAAIFAAKPLPEIEPSPDRNWLAMVGRDGLPSVNSLGGSSLTVGGLEVDVKSGSLWPDWALGTELTLVDARTGQRSSILKPSSGHRITAPLWSPDSRAFLFARKSGDAIELWQVSAATGTARPLMAEGLWGIRGGRVPCAWLSDSRRVLCQLVPDRSDEARPSLRTPPQPEILQSTSEESHTLNRGDTLQSSRDAALFDFYLRSQLWIIDTVDGSRRRVGEPQIYDHFSVSPDGKYILAVRLAAPPLPYGESSLYFPREFEVLSTDGDRVRTLHTRATGRWGNLLQGWAPKGHRHYSWALNLPSSLIYVEALDDGDPHRAASHRDRLLLLAAPFTAEPRQLLRSVGRLIAIPESRRWTGDYEFPSLGWFRDGAAWVEEIDYPARRKRVWRVELSKRAIGPPQLVFDFIYENRNSGPGLPLLVGGSEHANPMLEQDGDWIYFAGRTPSAHGDRPYLDRFNMRSRRSERLFISSDAAFEEPIALAADNRLVLRREAADLPPAYQLLESRSKARTDLTDPSYPAEVREVKSQLIEYQRVDGVKLSGTLCLPANYHRGTTLPVLIWAYPREFRSAAAAAEVHEPVHQYAWDVSDPIRLATCRLASEGYAVLWDAGMPVIGDANANDTAMQQFVANSAAAIEKLVELGIADRNKIAIGGFSYGAAMAALLMAETDLFAAGIAIAGPYNLTLTPGGFQNERRTLWQAPQLYSSLSALFQASRIKAPLLLVHGEEDQTAAAPVLQSRQMFQALKALGRPARLVILPREGHVPFARESIEHLAWEIQAWLDQSLKGEYSYSSHESASSLSH